MERERAVWKSGLLTEDTRIKWGGGGGLDTVQKNPLHALKIEIRISNFAVSEKFKSWLWRLQGGPTNKTAVMEPRSAPAEIGLDLFVVHYAMDLSITLWTEQRTEKADARNLSPFHWTSWTIRCRLQSNMHFIIINGSTPFYCSLAAFSLSETYKQPLGPLAWGSGRSRPLTAHGAT
jgi:hypothetical protein